MATVLELILKSRLKILKCEKLCESMDDRKNRNKENEFERCYLVRSKKEANHIN